MGLRREAGSHTVTHIDMVNSSEDVISRELIGSKKKIENAIGNEVISFAYPHGSHGETAAKLARSIYRGC
ncbi:MAG: polysaccharide deacetylase family protein [Infirmifilum sp.]